MPILAAVDQEMLVQVERSMRVLGKVLFRLPHNARGTGGDVRIDRSGYAVLGVLDDIGEARLSDVACQLQLDVSTVSRQVKDMQTHGFLQRRDDPDDRRAGLLELTTSGRRELHRMRQERVAVLTAATESWPARDRQRFMELLDDLATRAAGLQGTR